MTRCRVPPQHGSTGDTAAAGRAVRLGSVQAVDPLLAELIDSLVTTPAIVTDEHFKVIGSNALARAVSPSLAVGVDLAEATFVNRSAHRTLADWDLVSARMAELLREAAGEIGGLPPSHALAVRMDHPEVGMLEITYELMRLSGTAQSVIMGHTEPGSASEQRLFALAAHLHSDEN